MDRKCSSCAYSVKDPNEIGKFLCVSCPPQVSIVMTPQGPAVMSMYPSVSDNLPACAHHTPTNEGGDEDS